MHHHHKSSNVASAPALFSRLRWLRHQHRARDATKLFVIEGIRQFIQASEGGFEFDALVHSPVLLRNGVAQRLVRRLARDHGVQRITVTPEEFRSICTTERASGIAAIVKQRWVRLSDADPHRGLGWLIVEQLRSAGNLGTILRTAEAVGMSGVIFVGDACDPYDPAVVRASMGGLFHIPLIRTSGRELSFWLAKHEIKMIGLSPHAQQLWTDLPQGARYALVLGEERTGLSPRLRRLCDTQVRLPMIGRADSLNVAVSAGVMMYELVRRAQP